MSEVKKVLSASKSAPKDDIESYPQTASVDNQGVIQEYKLDIRSVHRQNLTIEVYVSSQSLQRLKITKASTHGAIR